MRRAIAFAPFAVLVFILPFPGTVALRLLALAASFVVAVSLWRASRPPVLPIRLPIALWALVAIASLATAVDPAYSLGEIKNELGYTMMAFVAFFVLTRDAHDLARVLRSLVASALVLAIWILALRIGTGVWDEGARHGGRGSFATWAVTVLPVLALAAAMLEARWQRYAAGLAAALVFAAAVYSQQRAIWPVIAAQALAALWLMQRGGMAGLTSRRVALALAAIIALTAAAWIATHTLRLAEQGPVAVTLTDDTRVLQHRVITARILEHPWTGSGFGREAMKLAHRDLIPASNPLLWHAHNVVLNYGLSMGLPGMAVLLLLFGALLREYWRFARAPDCRVRLIGAAGFALVAGVFLRNQANDFFVRDMALLFWALNGALLGAGARLRQAMR